MVEVAEEAPKQYKSKFYKRTLEQLQYRKEMEEAKAELKLEMMERKLNYAKYVKEMHAPLVSEVKQQEMNDLRRSLKHPVRPSNRVSPGAQH